MITTFRSGGNGINVKFNDIINTFVVIERLMTTNCRIWN